MDRLWCQTQKFKVSNKKLNQGHMATKWQNHTLNSHIFDS